MLRKKLYITSFVFVCLLMFDAIGMINNESSIKEKVPLGFFYVYQDNYIVVNLSDKAQYKKYKYLYSDGASSCIILIVTGKNYKGDNLVSLAHISRISGFKEYFSNVIYKTFVGPINIYGQGANPPSETSAQNVRNILLEIISINDTQDLTPNDESPYFSGIQLSLSQGSPIENNRDGFGIDLKTMKVSNKHFNLTLKDRDSYDGAMGLYSFYGRKILPPVWLRNAKLPLNHDMISKMLKLAYNDNKLRNIQNMSDKEIIQTLSTTPSIEVDWFAGAARMQLEYVLKHYKP